MADKHQPPKKSLLYNAIIVLLVMMFLNAFVFPLFTQPRVTEVTYDKFLAMLDNGEVREVALDDTAAPYSSSPKWRARRASTAPAPGRTTI